MAKKSLDQLLSSAPGGLSRVDASQARHLAREEMRRIERTAAADQLSGAGFAVDRQLRTFLNLCNNDLARGIDPPYAKVWDVVGGYFQRENAALVSYLSLRRERDHAFDAGDFFAWVGEPVIAENAMPRLRSLPEGVVHNFSVAGDVKEITFEAEGSPPIAFAGVSLVRHGANLHWQTAGGLVADLDGITRERRAVLADQEETVRRNNPNAPPEMIQDLLNPYARALPGVDGVWDCAALGVFDLDTERHSIRISTRDWGVSQSVFSDQFESVYAESYEQDEAIRRMVDRAIDQVERDHLFFEVAEAAFSLPAYFAARVEYVTDRQVRTALAGPGNQARQGKKAPPDRRILVRNVATLAAPAPSPGSKSYAPPRFQVEVEGFWRRLSPDSQGKDREGNAVKGRTWVQAHARWKDRPRRTGVVHLKTPIASALEKARKRAGPGGATDVTVPARPGSP